MKPITLTMQAFGSYGLPVTIDFRKPSQNLFLITGNTGSGKSTIFDAIVFALYGETSSESNKKDGCELQSQFVDLDVTPSVSLTFSESEGGQERIYTVTRVPKHNRKKKKRTGTGTTIESSGTVSLILPEGNEYSQNQKETNQKIMDIVGLTKSQFMQVAMIAQGEFVELLRAKSNDKKLIFRKLFGTQKFQDMVDRLDLRRKAQEARMKEIRTACQAEVSHIQVPEDFPEAEEMTGEIRRILKETELNSQDLQNLIGRLETLLALQKEARKAAAAAEAQASRSRDQQREFLQKAQALLGSFRQLTEAQNVLMLCQQQAREMEEAEALVSQLNHAFALKQIWSRLQDADNLLKASRENLRQQQALLPGLQQQAESKASAEDQAQQALTLQLQQYSAVNQRTERSYAILDHLDAARKELTEKNSLRLRSQAQETAARQALADFAGTVQARKARAEELKDAALHLAAWEADRKEAIALRKELQNAADLQAQAEDQQQTVTALQKDFKALQCRYEQKSREYDDLQNAFYSAQAGFLAREKLKENEPCPVCGSCFHPSPCQLPLDHLDLSRDQVEALGAQVGKLREQRAAASAKAGSGLALLEERQQRFTLGLKTLAQRMEPILSQTEISLTGLNADLSRWEQQLRDRKQPLQEAARELEAITVFLQRSDGQQQKLQENAEAAAQASAQVKTQVSALEGKLQSLESQKDFETREAAAAALSAAEKNRDQAQKLWDCAHSAADAAREALQQTQARICQLQEHIPGQQEAADRRKQEYEAAMEERRLPESQWLTLIQQHSPQEIPALQSKLQDYRDRKSSAAALEQSAKAAIGDQPRPDLEALTAGQNSAEEAWKQARKALEEAGRSLEITQRAYEALAPRMEERTRISGEYNRINRLYRRLHGVESGARMDIETFVQRYYLKRVLAAANRRFEEMSAGQFSLQMTDEEMAGSGANRGLDLMVYSAVTGQVREVRTLSGGESFMAALSLALGMADQIQSASAAIHLDMMFIDEGFGSLDAHSRDQAVRVLQQMAGGSKLIGIISHVSELKQAIDDQLLITKDETGSHAAWL